MLKPSASAKSATFPLTSCASGGWGCRCGGRRAGSWGRGGPVAAPVPRDPAAPLPSPAAPGRRVPARPVRDDAPRPLRASDRHHRAPGISRSWQQNGRITAQSRTLVAPLFGRCDVHRSSTGNESRSPRTPPSPVGVRAGRQVSAVRASGPQCRGHTTAKAGLEHRSIRPIRPDHQFWYERPAGPAGIRPHIRHTSACPAPSRPLSPARAYAVVRRTRRRGGVVRGAAVPVGRAPRGVAWACCARYSTSWSPASSSSCSLMML